MGAPWSRQLEERYELRLTDDLRAWLDDGLWQGAGGTEFHQPLAPEQLLAPEPGVVWGGFMLPDTLPWIGNGYGDWLCLRIGTDSRVTEIVHWSHVGGGWLPVGASLPEALLYDAGRHRATPRTAGAPGPEIRTATGNPFADWASHWLRATRGLEIPCFWQEPAERTHGALLDPLEILGERQLAQFAVARDRVLRHLESPLKTRGDRPFASQLGVHWEPEFVRWLFDGQQVPAERRPELAGRMQLPVEQMLRQDWASAEAIAREVVAQRGDLGWPFDLLGWAAERRGAAADAAHWYACGLQASIFSDEATRLRTHWFAEAYGKFAAARLAELRSHLSPEDAANPYVQLYLDENRATLRERVAEYWLEGARTAVRQQDWPQAYHGYYQAGWDLGWQTLRDFDEVLAGLETSARAAGWMGRAALAALHQRNL